MMQIASDVMGFKVKKNANGKIKIKSSDITSIYIKVTLIVLLIITVGAFISFDYKDIQIIVAIKETLANLKTMFFEASLSHFS